MTPHRFLLLAAALALPATAQAQSEPNKPYNLHIVVHVAPNRLLTDVFRDRIERELRDGFQAALGDMGRVTVSHKHKRLDDVLTRGLKQSLDGWTDRDDVKTHFVLIDYSGVHYEIWTRQYDGSIGRASPVVRYDRTRDRDFVAKAAALLLKMDFGILGTVRGEPDVAKQGAEVQIELRGGALGNLARWIKKGEVFALAPPGGGSSATLDWALLQVEKTPEENARGGLCTCRFFHRYRVPSIAGYRCIKLGTVETPLRLRWMAQMSGKKSKPLDLPLSVDIRRQGFDGEEGTRLHKDIERNGILETVGDEGGVFHNVAFVSVTDGMPEPRPRVPIALIDDQPIVITVNASRDFNTLLAIDQATWQRNVADCLQMQVNLFKRLETLGSKAEQRDEVIQEARRGLKRLQTERAYLIDRRRELARQMAEKHQPELKMPVEDSRLAQIEKYEKALTDFINEQERIEAKENDPQRKKWLSEIGRAKLLEKELEFGKAIKIYESIQKEGFKDDALDKHLQELRQLWKVANDEHRKAREFIYGAWPTLDSARLAKNLDKVRKAVKTCEDVDDLLTLQKFLKGSVSHANRITKELEELHPDIIRDDVQPAKELQKLSQELKEIVDGVSEYVKSKAADNG
jgi:hypothetical protein